MSTNSRVRFGKRPYTVIRDVGGGDWVEGNYVPAQKQEIIIVANVQPNFPQYLTKLLPEGKREKEAVWFSSDNWLYTTRTGDAPLEADLLKYRTALWEVLVVRPFGNFGTHCECVAVKLDKDDTNRVTGKVERIS